MTNMRQRVRRWTSDDLERIRQVQTFISQNIHLVKGITQLSSLAAMNEKKLNEGFAYLFEKKPKQYILEQRMNRGRDLLLQTDDTVQHIAAACGYADASSFYRAFKKFYGILPASLRNFNTGRTNKD